MQIVIDIDDRVYGLLKYFEKSMGLNDKKDSDDDVKTALMRAVINGTPLPKGHGDLIDRDLLQNAMYDLCDEAGILKDNPWRENPHIDAITDVISFAPTIIGADTEGSESE